jgi:hypothetical protein
MEFKGTWSAATNTPTLVNGTGNAGDVYEVSAAGTVNFGAGGIAFALGDYVVYDGATWQYSSGQKGTITSVALTMPSAFSVSGSPITTSGTFAITGAGDTTQYIAGDGSLVTFPIAGQAGTLIREIRNTTGATLTKGTVVYISGATGNKATVSKAIATGDSTSAQTFGLCQTDIANNSNGYVVCVGDITGLDTSAFTEGVQLYLSSTTAGTYTSTKQLAPAHLVYIGVVTRSHPTQGQIEVKIQNGYELDEIHDVAISSKANNDGLFYESSTSLWKNKSIATVLGYTPQAQLNGTGFVKASGTTISYDNSTYLTTSSAASTYLPLAGGTMTGNLFIDKNSPLIYLEDNASNSAYSIKVESNSFIIYNEFAATARLTITGTSATLAANLTATSLIKTGGTSSQFLMADGSVSTGPAGGITGTGTTNYIPKFTGASTIGNSLVFDNGTQIGINTASPAATLDVNGTIYSRSASGIFSDVLTAYSGGNLTLGYGASGSLIFNGGSAGATRMTLNASGNLGLGVTPSAWRNIFNAFQIGYTGALYSITTGTAVEQVNLASNYYQDSAGSELRIQAGFATRYQQASGEHRWSIAGTSTANSAISFTQAMTLFANGNLAVGTTTDAGYKLDVNGTGRFSGTVTTNGEFNVNPSSGDGILRILTASTERAAVRANATKFIIEVGTFGERLSINNSSGLLTYTGAATFSSSVDIATSTGTSLVYSLTPTGWNGAKHRLTVPTSGNTSMWSWNWNGSARDYASYGSSNIQLADNVITFSNGTGNPSEVARFNGTNLLVGTTTDAGYKLDVNGTGRFSTSLTVGAGGLSGRLSVRGTTNDSSAYSFEAANSSGNSLFIVRNDGAATFSSSVTARQATINGLGGSRYQMLTLSAGGTSDEGLFITTTGTGNDYYAIKVATGGNANAFSVTNAGNVGIGTTSPTYKLVVSKAGAEGMEFDAGTIIAGRNYIINYNRSTSAYTDFQIDANNIMFGTAGTERMRITSGGNVGIGTTSPAEILHLARYGTTTLEVQNTRGSSIGYFSVLDSEIQLQSGTNHPLTFLTYGSERMRILANGNVGIGTTSPAARLTVQTTTTSSTDSFRVTDGTGVINIGHWDTVSNRIESSGKPTYIVQYGASNYIALGTDGSERMRIVAGGEVGIGTSSPQYKLDVNGSARVVSSLISNNYSGTTLGSGGVYFSGDASPDFGFIGYNYTNVSGTESVYQSIRESWRIRFGNGATKTMSFGMRVGSAAASAWSEYFSLASGGAATFSSSVTAGGNYLTSAGQLRFYNVANNNWTEIKSPKLSGDTEVDFQITTKTGQFYINASGNVGIGTTSPSSKLHIESTTNTSLTLVAPSGYQTALELKGADQWYRLISQPSVSGSRFDIYNQTLGAFAFSVASNSDVYLYANVGIGTTSPSFATGTGLAIFATSTDARIALKNTASGNASTDGFQLVFTTQSEAVLENRENASMRFLTNATEAMRITAAGDLLIGKTAKDYTSNGAQFEQNGKIFGVTSGIASENLFLNKISSQTGNFVNFLYNSGSVGTISTNGSTTSYNTTSDYRLKEDLKSINGLDIVNKINVYDYKWKTSNDRMDGVLAHELAEVLPYAVSGVKDGELMQGVDYSKIVPVMVQAIKELKAELDTLKNN